MGVTQQQVVSPLLAPSTPTTPTTPTPTDANQRDMDMMSGLQLLCMVASENGTGDENSNRNSNSLTSMDIMYLEQQQQLQDQNSCNSSIADSFGHIPSILNQCSKRDEASSDNSNSNNTMLMMQMQQMQQMHMQQMQLQQMQMMQMTTGKYMASSPVCASKMLEKSPSETMSTISQQHAVHLCHPGHPGTALASAQQQNASAVISTLTALDPRLEQYRQLLLQKKPAPQRRARTLKAMSSQPADHEDTNTPSTASNDYSSSKLNSTPALVPEPVSKPAPDLVAAQTLTQSKGGVNGASGINGISSSCGDKGGKKEPRSDVYTRFSPEEEIMLIQGVLRFGVGNWKRILDQYPFHHKRNAIDLKDKHRNLMRRLERLSNGSKTALNNANNSLAAAHAMNLMNASNGLSGVTPSALNSALLGTNASSHTAAVDGMPPAKRPRTA